MISGVSLGIIGIVVFSFLCQYMDCTLGMGYGTTLTPVLLIFGFTPMQIVPVILLSELFSGILAGFFHHKEGNVDFSLKTTNFSAVIRTLKALGYVESFKQNTSLHLKIVLLLTASSFIGVIAAVFIAINIPKAWLTLYIGCLVLSMGLIILVTLNRKFTFSWVKMIVLGTVASFNKGMSGGGYGPVVTGGQILAGVETKNAIGITSLAEGLTCLVGLTLYIFVAKDMIDWKLAPYIVSGAIFSVPFAAISVKNINTKKMKLATAMLTIILGIVTIISTLKT